MIKSFYEKAHSQEFHTLDLHSPLIGICQAELSHVGSSWERRDKSQMCFADLSIGKWFCKRRSRNSNDLTHQIRFLSYPSFSYFFFPLSNFNHVLLWKRFLYIGSANFFCTSFPLRQPLFRHAREPPCFPLVSLRFWLTAQTGMRNSQVNGYGRTIRLLYQG